MKSTGIVRRVDELGRVVIPIELRNKFDSAVEGIKNMKFEPLELISTQVVAGTNYMFLAKDTANKNDFKVKSKFNQVLDSGFQVRTYRNVVEQTAVPVKLSVYFNRVVNKRDCRSSKKNLLDGFRRTSVDQKVIAGALLGCLT